MKLFTRLFIVLILSSALLANNVLTFDGTDDYVAFENAATLMHSSFTAHTISLWFQTVNTTNSQMIFETGGSWNGINFYIKDGKFYAGVWTEGSSNVSNSTGFFRYWFSRSINANEWYYAALVYEKSGTDVELTLVFNGTTESQTFTILDYSNFDGSISDHPNGAAIGVIHGDTKIWQSGSPNNTDINGLDYYFEGSIDNLGLANAAVPTSVLLDLYQNPFSPSGSILLHSPYATYLFERTYSSNSFIDNDLDNLSAPPYDEATTTIYDGKIYGDPINNSDNSLPVELSDFYAESKAGNVEVIWTTESEINNAGFNLYRSEDDITYEKINDNLIKGAINSTTAHNYEFVDVAIKGGVNYYYKLEDVTTSGETTRHGPVTVFAEETDVTDKAFVLGDAYPNPFNPSTTINFMIAKEAKITINIYDMQGKRVNTLTDQVYSVGNYQVEWASNDVNGNPVSAGVYIYQMITSTGYSESAKMILIR